MLIARSDAFLDYGIHILKLKVAYFTYEVISGNGACIVRKCEFFIIQKLSTYLSTLLANSQNVPPFTELSNPVDTTTVPVNTTIPIPCSDQTKASLHFTAVLSNNTVQKKQPDKCVLVSAREEVLCQAESTNTHILVMNN